MRINYSEVSFYIDLARVLIFVISIVGKILRKLSTIKVITVPAEQGSAPGVILEQGMLILPGNTLYFIKQICITMPRGLLNKLHTVRSV